MLTARRAMPSASVQNAGDVSASSTTSRIARTNSSSCSAVAISGGAAFRTIKLFPQICVRIRFSRNMRITMICPNIAGCTRWKASYNARTASFFGGTNSIPLSRPMPRTSLTISKPASDERSLARTVSPRYKARAPRSSFSRTSRVASPARMEVFTEGRGVHDGALQRRVDGVINFVGDQHGADRHQAAADRFRQDHDIGPQTKLVRCQKSPGAKHARLHFIDHKKCAGAAAQFLRMLQILAGWNANSAFGLQRLQN